MLSKSLARLSSGSKITTPADDAAGLAVSLNFSAQIKRNAAAANNVGNAISFSQTQDGFLGKVGKALDRMSELSILSQDVTKSDADRALYNTEFTTLKAYISDTAGKDFNGVSLFGATGLAVTKDTDGGTFTMNAANLGANAAYTNVKTGGTAFQREVWAALRTIRTGETTTYGRLAAKLGRPRAVGGLRF